MSFTLGDIATTGLPVGEHVIRVDDVEASTNSAGTNDTLVFKATVAQSENPKVKVGSKHIWSYTYLETWRSIVANDLVRAGLPKETRLDGNAKNDAIVITSAMRGNYYVVVIKENKKDKTMPPSTSFLKAYAGGAATQTVSAAAPIPPAVGAIPAAVAPAPVAPAPIAPVAPVPVSVVPAPVAPPAPVAAPIAPVAPAPVAPVAPVAPAAVVPAPAPPAAPVEPALTGELIQAIQLASLGQGAPYPGLNATQIRQLREIGMPEVAVLYEALVPAPAATAFLAV